MWKKKSKNIFTINFSNIKKSKNYIYLPDLNDNLITYKVNTYKLIKNNSNIRTIHAINKNNKAIITIYDDYLDAFILNDNGNYCIKLKENNIYELKQCCNNKNPFKCNVRRTNANIDNCGCGFTEKPKSDEIKSNANSKNYASIDTLTDFTFGDKIREYRIIYGLTSSYKNVYNNDTTTLWNQLVHITNIINLVYQNSLSCYFILDQTDQENVINSTDFDNFTSNNITSFTSTFNGIITSNNYDIGHVLSNGNGGLAYLNSLCSSNKGDGWTSADPTNDQVFVIDYMGHELGHQFGCNHIHQNCNNTSFSNFEPGSGSTIMAYTGICAPNIQSNSDPYFNRYNVWEAKQHLESTSCATETNSNQPIPIINNAYDTNIKYIPDNIAFELYADNVTNISTAHNLFYTWEGIDLASKAIIRSKMLNTSYRTISNVGQWDQLLTPIKVANMNISQIKLYNGYTNSTAGTWSGTFTVTHYTSETDNTTTTTNVTFNLSGVGSATTTINIGSVLWNPINIDVNISFSTTDNDTWASDLLVVLTNDDAIDILRWGGYNSTNDVPVNSTSWSTALQNNNTSTYNETIPIDTMSSNAYSFQLTIRALYQYSNVNTNNNIVPFTEDYFSTIASKKLFTVEPYTTTNTLQITNETVNNNVITLTWDKADTDQSPFNASNVTIYASNDDGQTWNYNSRYEIYTGTNNGSATITITDSQFLNTNIKLKMKFSNNLFILVSNTLYLTGSSGITYYVRLASTTAPTTTIPYYLFSNTSGGTALNDVNTQLNLVPGQSYIFERTDSGHPFNIGSAHNQNNTGITITSNGTGNAVNGANSIVNGEQLSFTIPTNYTSELKYFCNLHSGMIGSFSLDNTNPTMTITAAEIINNESYNNGISLIFTSSEDTANFVAAGVSVTNGSISNFSGSGSNYTANFTATSEGTCSVIVNNNQYTDPSGNNNVQSNTFTWYYDITAPVITLLGNTIINHIVGTTFTDPGYTASDNYDGTITNLVSVNGDTVYFNVLGTYIITYDVIDSAHNNAVQVTRTVNVVDNTSPVITLIGSATINHEVNTTYTDQGATANDNYDGDLTSNIAIGGNTINENTLGIYIITYNVSDSSGNAATEVTRTVNVVDNTSPVITLTGSTTVNHEANTTYTDQGATANDNYDGDLTNNITVGGNTVDVNTLGQYIITYNVSDSSGNAATEVIRTVNVVEINNISVTVNVHQGWNLVSLPISSATNTNYLTLFPDADIYTLFSYNGSKYQLETKLVAGKGYWLRFPSAYTYTFNVNEVNNTSVTVNVNQGWNLVSLPISSANNTNYLTLFPDADIYTLFSYNGSKYQLETNLVAGKCYWLRFPSAYTYTYSD